MRQDVISNIKISRFATGFYSIGYEIKIKEVVGVP
jgi:hypothetical protein